MPPKKSKSKNNKQLQLPLKYYSHHETTNIKCEPNIIFLPSRLDQKQNIEKIRQRKKRTKILIDYAQSLDW